MTKNEVEKYILKLYPQYIEECNKLALLIQSKLNFLIENNENGLQYYQENDIRLACLTRLNSVVINTKTNLFFLFDFINKDQWDTDYYIKILKDIEIPKDYYGFIKDLDTDYKFLFYTQFFSQIESFSNELCKTLTNKDCLTYLLEKSETIEVDFILFTKAIRNSIHNNGYHLPTDKRYSNLVYRNNMLKDGAKINFFDWMFGFEICCKLLEHTVEAINSNDIMKIKIKSDRQ